MILETDFTCDLCNCGCCENYCYANIEAVPAALLPVKEVLVPDYYDDAFFYCCCYYYYDIDVDFFFFAPGNFVRLFEEDEDKKGDDANSNDSRFVAVPIVEFTVPSS